MREPIRITRTTAINTIEKLALAVGQESTVDCPTRFRVGWIAQQSSNDIGGVGLFEYEDGFVVDYLSPSLDSASFPLVEALIERVIEEAKENGYFPLSIVRDRREALYFVDTWGFEEVTINQLPYSYAMNTAELCSKCPKNMVDCVPTVFRHNG